MPAWNMVTLEIHRSFMGRYSANCLCRTVKLYEDREGLRNSRNEVAEEDRGPQRRPSRRSGSTPSGPVFLGLFRKLARLGDARPAMKKGTPLGRPQRPAE